MRTAHRIKQTKELASLSDMQDDIRCVQGFIYYSGSLASCLYFIIFILIFLSLGCVKMYRINKRMLKNVHEKLTYDLLW